MRRRSSSIVRRLALGVAAVAATLNVAPPIANAQVAPQVATTTTVHLDLDPSRLAAEQVATLARQMTEPVGEQDGRDDAARRLLSIGTAEARNAVQFALRDPGNNAGRLAAARAIADDAPADPDFVDALFVLLDADVPRPLMDAAAIAIGNYKSLPEVAVRLVDLTDARRAEAVRIAAVRALSKQIEKRAAARLVELAQDVGSPAVAVEAITALQMFASLPYDSGVDWAAWWRGQAELSDDRFCLDVLTARATRFEQQARRGDETYQELRRSVLATLSSAPRAERGDVLVRHLTSPREVVRLIAIRQAHEDAVTTADLPPASRPVIRAMLADVSAEVRVEAARIAFDVYDVEAFPALAQQIAVEPETRVRAEMANALGKIGNVDALPLLRPLLDDPSNLVVQAAAGALANMGPAMVAANPREASELSIRLQRVLEQRGNAAGGTLRESLVTALVPLRERSLRAMFAGMLTHDPPESARIRQLAAQGLGEIGDPNTDSVLVDALLDESPLVRREAVVAIGKVSNSFVHASRLYKLLDVQTEADADVRAAAWNVIRERLAVAPLGQLEAWPDFPNLRNDDAKRLEIFAALAAGYAKANRPDEHSHYLQEVGETHMRLGSAADDGATAAQHYTAATATFQEALAIARQAGLAMRVQSMMVATMRSMLVARDYAGAVRFVQGATRDYQGVLFPELKLEAERLAADVKTFDAANELIRAAEAMGAALPEQTRVQLAAIRLDIERRKGERNEFALPDVLQTVCVR